MIKSLLIENFKSHQKTFLRFHKGVNVIVGLGMSGKTNIIRSIKMVKDFRPLNQRYKSNFAKNKKTKIEIKTTEGKTISLERKDKKAKYILEYGENKQVFRKFNKSVPKEITAALNMEDINLQEQLDFPYLVLDTPGQITKIINRITGTNKIDNWIKKLNAEIRNKKAVIQDTIKEKKEAKDKLRRLDGLEEIEPTIIRLEKINKKTKKKKLEHYFIEKTIFQMENIDKEIEEYSKALKVVRWVKRLEEVKKEKENLLEQKLILTELIDIDKQIKIHKEVLKNEIELLSREISKQKICPFCYGEITSKNIKRIQNEIYSNI